MEEVKILSDEELNTLLSKDIKNINDRFKIYNKRKEDLHKELDQINYAIESLTSEVNERYLEVFINKMLSRVLLDDRLTEREKLIIPRILGKINNINHNIFNHNRIINGKTSDYLYLYENE